MSDMDPQQANARTSDPRDVLSLGFALVGGVSLVVGAFFYSIAFGFMIAGALLILFSILIGLR